MPGDEAESAVALAREKWLFDSFVLILPSRPVCGTVPVLRFALISLLTQSLVSTPRL